MKQIFEDNPPRCFHFYKLKFIKFCETICRIVISSINVKILKKTSIAMNRFILLLLSLVMMMMMIKTRISDLIPANTKSTITSMSYSTCIFHVSANCGRTCDVIAEMYSRFGCHRQSKCLCVNSKIGSLARSISRINS